MHRNYPKGVPPRSSNRSRCGLPLPSVFRCVQVDSGDTGSCSHVHVVDDDDGMFSLSYSKTKLGFADTQALDVNTLTATGTREATKHASNKKALHCGLFATASAYTLASGNDVNGRTVDSTNCEFASISLNVWSVTRHHGLSSATSMACDPVCDVTC